MAYKAPTYKEPKYTAPAAYKSQYSTQIGDLINKAVNREKFTYDPATDTSYQALAKQYGRLGERANENTMAEAAANTGGIASSYAISAANQAQNDYNQQLSNQIPALMEVAYSRYKDNWSMDMDALNTLQAQDESMYRRWNDNRLFGRDVYESDRGYGRDVYESDRDYKYQKGRDKVTDKQWNKTFAYQKARDKVADKQWNKTFAASKKKVGSGGSKSSGSSKSSGGSRKSYSGNSSKGNKDYNIGTKNNKNKSKSKNKNKSKMSAIDREWLLANKNAFSKKK